jgi:hypothetical protein
MQLSCLCVCRNFVKERKKLKRHTASMLFCSYRQFIFSIALPNCATSGNERHQRRDGECKQNCELKRERERSNQTFLRAEFGEVNVCVAFCVARVGVDFISFRKGCFAAHYLVSACFMRATLIKTNSDVSGWRKASARTETFSERGNNHKTLRRKGRTIGKFVLACRSQPFFSPVFPASLAPMTRNSREREPLCWHNLKGEGNEKQKLRY